MTLGNGTEFRTCSVSFSMRPPGNDHVDRVISSIGVPLWTLTETPEIKLPFVLKLLFIDSV
jgi:hypothetical protein